MNLPYTALPKFQSVFGKKTLDHKRAMAEMGMRYVKFSRMHLEMVVFKTVAAGRLHLKVDVLKSSQVLHYTVLARQVPFLSVLYY